LAQNGFQDAFLMAVQVHNRENLLEYGVVLMKALDDVGQTLFHNQVLLLDFLPFECTA
jgi:hypothetical protein